MGEAVRLHRIAEKCLSRLGAPGKPSRLVLSLFFKATLGIQRIFHFETIDDLGFAILTGGTRTLSRNVLGGLVRAAPVRGVLKFVHQTSTKIRRARSITVSIDEHAIARFTRKFSIKKGFHTIRNKHMKIEKLTFSFDVATRQVLSLAATNASAKLTTLADKLLRRLRPRVRGAEVRVILDAGAAKDHAEILKLADRPNQVLLVRAPRRPAYRRTWASLAPSAWTRLEEEGPYRNAPPKVIHFAETRTTIRSRSSARTVKDRRVRTVVIREERGRGKDRWHALWIFGDEATTAYRLIQEFRTRQHHEQTYRILLHDAFIDTAPSGYNKRSANIRRPGFRQNALTLYAWLAGLAANAFGAVTKQLPPRFAWAHPRTIRRWLLNVPAELYLGDGTLIILLQPKRLLRVWAGLVRRANAANTRIPWLDNRRLVLSLHPRTGGRRQRTPANFPEGAIDPRIAA